MKKIMVSAAIVAFMTTAAPIETKGNSEILHSNTRDSISVVDSVAMNALILRVNEIESQDKSSLTKTERKEMKKELKSIKSEMKKLDRGGVYISIGGLIIIILLLILIL